MISSKYSRARLASFASSYRCGSDTRRICRRADAKNTQLKLGVFARVRPLGLEPRTTEV